MRISDRSSDVCSSDLGVGGAGHVARRHDPRTCRAWVETHTPSCRLQGQCDRMDAGRLARRGRSAQRRRVAEGVAMARQLEHFPNLVAMFFARAAEKGDAPFLWAKKHGEWGSTS